MVIFREEGTYYTVSIQFERPLEGTLAAIANHFHLGAVLSFESMGGTNQNYLVTTTQGEYLFKIIVNTTIEDMLNGLPFLDHLKKSNFEFAVYYLQSPDGSVVYQSEDYNAVVLPRLPGARPLASPAVNWEVGKHLAQLHRIPSDGLPEKRHWLDTHYLTEAVPKAVEQFGPERLHETLAIFQSFAHFQPAMFPQSIIHGDLDKTNCLFEGDQLVAFIDWQDVGIGATILDFAMAILGFCFVKQPEGSNYWAIFDANLYRALFEGYVSVRPFSATELANLDVALKYVGLTQPVWFMLAWDQYYPGKKMIETDLLYWKFGLHEMTLPTSDDLSS